MLCMLASRSRAPSRVLFQIQLRQSSNILQSASLLVARFKRGSNAEPPQPTPNPTPSQHPAKPTIKFTRVFVSDELEGPIHTAVRDRIIAPTRFSDCMYNTIVHNRNHVGMPTYSTYSASLRFKTGVDSWPGRWELATQCVLASLFAVGIMVLFRNHFGVNSGFMAVALTYGVYLSSVVDAAKEMTRNRIVHQYHLNNANRVPGTQITTIQKVRLGAGQSVLVGDLSALNAQGSTPAGSKGNIFLRFPSMLWQGLRSRMTSLVFVPWVIQRGEIFATICLIVGPQLHPITHNLWDDCLLAVTCMLPSFGLVGISVHALVHKTNVLDLFRKEFFVTRSGAAQWAVGVGALWTAEAMREKNSKALWTADATYFVVNGGKTEKYVTDISETDRAVVKLWRVDGDLKVRCLTNEQGEVVLKWKEAEDLLNSDIRTSSAHNVEVVDMGCGIGKWVMGFDTTGPDFVIPDSKERDHLRLTVDHLTVSEDCEFLLSQYLATGAVSSIRVRDSAPYVRAWMRREISDHELFRQMGECVADALVRMPGRGDDVLRRIMKSARGRRANASNSHPSLPLIHRGIHFGTRLRAPQNLRTNEKSSPNQIATSYHSNLAVFDGIPRVKGQAEVHRVATQLARRLIARTTWFRAFRPNDQNTGEDRLRLVLFCTVDPFNKRTIHAKMDPDNPSRVVSLSSQRQPGTLPLRVQYIQIVRLEENVANDGPVFDISVDRLTLDLSNSLHSDWRLPEIVRFVSSQPTCAVVNLSNNRICGETHFTGSANPLQQLLMLPHVQRVNLSQNPLTRNFLATLSPEQHQKILYTTADIRQHPTESHTHFSHIQDDLKKCKPVNCTRANRTLVKGMTSRGLVILKPPQPKS